MNNLTHHVKSMVDAAMTCTQPCLPTVSSLSAQLPSSIAAAKAGRSYLAPVNAEFPAAMLNGRNYLSPVRAGLLVSIQNSCRLMAQAGFLAASLLLLAAVTEEIVNDLLIDMF